MKATQPVSIGGVELDALMKIDRSYSSDIPNYPVEDGFSVHDTITAQPLEINISALLTNTPVTWRDRFGASTTEEKRTDTVIANLQKLYTNRDIVTIITSEETFDDMGLTSIGINKNGQSYEVSISAKKVTKTTTHTVGIPSSYGKSGKSGTSAGVTKTVSAGTLWDSDGTILYNIKEKGLSGLFGG
jgi:hypothetical protein